MDAFGYALIRAMERDPLSPLGAGGGSPVLDALCEAGHAQAQVDEAGLTWYSPTEQGLEAADDLLWTSLQKRIAARGLDLFAAEAAVNLAGRQLKRRGSPYGAQLIKAAYLMRSHRVMQESLIMVEGGVAE